MKTQHTHGPWYLNGNGILLHPVTGSQLVTQKIETSLGSFEIFDETNEPDANARLIAAAPDLLEALRDCITSEGASCFGQMEKHPEWMQRRLYAISDIARAAIAKATGGEE